MIVYGERFLNLYSKAAKTNRHTKKQFQKMLEESS